MEQNSIKISERKKEHIDICLNSDVTYKKSNGFEKYDFIHNPITEVKIDEIDFSSNFLEKKISLPFIISSMTGGTKETTSLNEKLSIIANELNIPIGVGSQRIMLEDSLQESSFNIVRKNAPKVPIMSNIGAAQIVQLKDVIELKRIIDPIEADGLIVHLNPLQELLQLEGDRDFSELLNRLEEIKNKIDIPLIVKEVGSGFDYNSAEKLLNSGVDVIDVAGAGGTSWAAVELKRNDDESNYYFREWGYRTSYSIREISKLKKKQKFILIGSGGISTFDDAAKAIALGADIVASAGTILKTLDSSGVGGVINFIINLFIGIKKIMFLTGSSTILELQQNKILRKEDLF
ncbi:MAG: type 2 isopentenyl-diphosphate Delta-isomerase [Melioribacteraceae bacterium]|nr:type 2 isopentenyl-diphosphate Delta-isomerase [Melioribacteraceae bacterium]